MPTGSEYRALFDHLEWIGYVQPVGLVVSATALLECQAYVDRNIFEPQQALLACLSQDSPRRVTDFPNAFWNGGKATLKHLTPVKARTRISAFHCRNIVKPCNPLSPCRIHNPVPMQHPG